MTHVNILNLFLCTVQVMLIMTQTESLDDTNVLHTHIHTHTHSLTHTHRHRHTQIFVHMLGLMVNRLLSWPLCLPFFSFLALPVWGVEVGGLVFLAERGAWTSATALTSSCSASCTKQGSAGWASRSREDSVREYKKKQKKKNKRKIKKRVKLNEKKKS